ncbi:hypothetical protein SDC9_139995 [bioreactor metagenome]|uniref:Uncharacterized protein n=1 Tax=bioreactor metagenome TaxID=1076179 RepID=A0A645DUA0_9ZZZZ|nr:DUF5685 family protein [Oscillospiraceae bacterium]
MFGYVKPAVGDLLVKHHELYKAVYCGLCHSVSSAVSPLMTSSLSYDFVFLALVRASLLGERFEIGKERCAVHPMKKRPSAASKSGDSLDFSAKAGFILTAYKIFDDINDRDQPFFKKLFLFPTAAFCRAKLRRIKKKDPLISSLSDFVDSRISSLSLMESSDCASLDKLCAVSGDILSEIFSFGLEGNEKLIASEIGSFVGRFIYTADAADDLSKDERHGSFNPLLNKYGSVTDAFSAFEDIDTAQSIYISRIDAAVSLLPRDSEYLPIIENITSLGLSSVFGNIIKKYEKQLSKPKGLNT